MNSIRLFIEVINKGMNYLVSTICLSWLLFIILRSTIRRIRQYQQARQRGEEEYPLTKGLYFGLIALIEAAILVTIFGYFPVIMEKASGYPASAFRWVLLYLFILSWFFLMTLKNSGVRGLISPLFVLSIGLVGWWFDRWIGFLLISLPLYLIIGYIVYQIAQVVIPVSSPEDSAERWPRFKALLWYLLGTQYPFWVPKDSVSREIEKRINGNLSADGYEPGIVWSHSHQVMGISAGIHFVSVDGPGVVFTKKGHRPIALTDLRTQIREAELDTTTKDGVPIQVTINTSFKIDDEDWPKKSWTIEDRKLLGKDKGANPLLEDGLRIDRKIGSYPYSTARIKSVLGATGINTTPPPEEQDVNVYWDEWALIQIQNAARQVISQRNLDQMWKPIGNLPDSSAMDEMADDIMELVEKPLRRVSIQFLGARIVGFSIDNKSTIALRQIESWKSLWSQKITAAQAQAEAIEKEEIEKAHTYAKSAILGAIAESIQKARLVNTDLPRHVIALYYIHAIEEYIRKRPEVIRDTDSKELFEAVKQSLLSN